MYFFGAGVLAGLLIGWAIEWAIDWSMVFARTTSRPARTSEDHVRQTGPDAG